MHKYKRTQREYAEIYSKSIATIKRWYARGYPLDDPEKMGEYLSPRGRKQDDPPEEPENISIGEIPQTPINLDDDFFQGEGIFAVVERLKKAERNRASAYSQAIQNNYPPTIVQNRFKEWVGIIETLRKLAKDEPEIRRLNDMTIDRAEMEAAISHIFAAFRTAARNVPQRAAAKLLAAREREEYVHILEDEIDLLLRTLTEISIDAAARADEEFIQSAQESEPPEESDGNPKPTKSKKSKKSKTA